jgi:hypothetical protein
MFFKFRIEILSYLKYEKMLSLFLLIKYYAMMMYGEVDVWIDVFLTSALVWRGLVSFTPYNFNPQGENPRYPFYGMLGGPKSRFERYRQLKILYSTGTRTSTPRLSGP